MPRETLRDSMRNIRLTARKELAGFFASPAAFLFLGAFLAVTLFVFFWVDTFFARGLADVRPLFQWIPLLLIFLVAALTMRAWAEERRAGTLVLLLTVPTTPTELVLGKFFGAMGLVAFALALTLPLPITVALLGPLDWGPVIGGYVAALALEVIEEEGLQRNAGEVGGRLKAGLRDLAARHPLIGDVRGMGLMLGVELVKDRGTKEPAREATAEVFERLRAQGILVGKGGLFGNVLRIKPPLCLTAADVDFALDVLDQVLAEV